MKKLFLIALSQIIYIGIATGQGTPPKAVLSDMPTQESMNAWQAKNTEIVERLNKVCADERFKLFYAKTPCKVLDITLQHMTDSSKANEAEKKVLLQIDAEFLAVVQMSTANYKLNTLPESLGFALANWRTKAGSEAQENLSNLYQGKITWGGYNTQRKAITVNGKAEFDKIIKDNAPQR